MVEEKNIEDLLKSIDSDFERLKKTPKRVVRACEEFFSGYSKNAEEISKESMTGRIGPFLLFRSFTGDKTAFPPSPATWMTETCWMN